MLSARSIAAGLVSVAALFSAACTGNPSARASSTKNDPPRKVRVQTIAPGEMARTVVVSGTLAAEEQVVLGMKVNGRLAEMRVDIGTRVTQSQILARLDPTDYQLRVDQSLAALQQARVRLGLTPDGNDEKVEPQKTATVKQAQATLDETRSKLNRSTQLFQQQLISQNDLDVATSAFQLAEGRFQDALEEVRNRQAILAQRRSELDLARQQLIATDLRSPFDGAVRERNAQAGEFIAVGAPVVTVVRLHPLRLRLAVPERETANVRMAQEVRVHVEGDPNTYTGKVVRLSPSIEEGSRTLLIEAEVPNERGVLRPGSFAKAEIVTESDHAVISVPTTSIVTFAGIEKVILVKDGKSLERSVLTGRRDGGRVEITQGLASGDMVVIQPGNLIGGQSVTVAQ